MELKEKLLVEVYKAISLRAPHEFLEKVFELLSKELSIDLAVLWVIDDGKRLFSIWAGLEEEITSEIEDLDKEFISTDKPIYISDISPSNEVFKAVFKQGFHSLLILPLIEEDEKKLTLGIFSKRSHAFDKEAQSFFSRIQDVFCAVARIWLYEKTLKEENEELKKKINEKEYELQFLYELSKSLSHTLNYDELLNLIAQHLHKVIKYDVVATLLVLDNAQKLIIYPDSMLSEQALKKLEYEISDTFYALTGNRLTQIQVIQKEAVKDNKIEALRSVFYVPIMSFDLSVIGLIFIGAEKKDAFSERQIRLVYRAVQYATEFLQRIKQLLGLDQKRFETILEFMHEGVILLDKTKRVIYANPSGLMYLAELAGISQGEQLDRLGYVPIEEFFIKEWTTLAINKPKLRVFEIRSSPIKNGDWIIVLRDVTEQREAFLKYRRALEGTISALATAIEKRDPYTAGHQRRVAELAKEIAKEMKLPDDTVQCIYLASLLHDIGKISVPSEILSKPSRLNNPEYELIKFHPTVGYEILKDIDFPWPIAEAVLYHHERLDGSGYPSGLKNGEIPIEARVIAVADVVEAISSHRPYRPALGMEKALKEIEKNKGRLYDPEVVDACIRVIKEKGFRWKE